MRRWSFAKGHGTENDFVVLLDRESMLDIGPAEVRYICNRRAGIGADGLLRAVLARHVDGWAGDDPLWFMDYRNADGSIAEMCGNGIRVFVRFLLEQDLVSGPVVPIATRSGLKIATALRDGLIRVSMGPVATEDRSIVVTTADGAEFKALTANVAKADAEAARYVHWGATSQDVIDTGAMLALRAGIDALLADINRAIAGFAGLTRQYRHTPVVART